MTKTTHRITISIYIAIIFASFVILSYAGRNYYHLPIEDRYYHPDYELLHPSGFIGHGLGIFGTILIVTGIFTYMVRKRMRRFADWGTLKHWLEFHIFLCTWGSVLVLFHTTFKFGGLISVGFWSLAIVWISGVIGRFIYTEIPRSIEGRELTLNEIQEMKSGLDAELMSKYGINFTQIRDSRISQIRLKLISNQIPHKDFRKAYQLIRKERKLEKRINKLEKMRNLFKHWHFAHLPFALIMLIIMVIHVSIQLYFGYFWIF